MKLFKLLVVLMLILNAIVFAQNRKDVGKFVEPKNHTWDTINKEINEFNKKPVHNSKKFIVDFDKINLPSSLDEFKTYWHNAPVMQSSTGTCWCFCGTSFLESDIFRLTGKEYKFSEMHTVYYEYLEKAKRFIQKHGDSFFGEGSQANAVTRIWKQYGCMPIEFYDGKKPGQKHHDHSKMFDEMKNYLEFCKSKNIWNEDEILKNVKSILSYYMGEPPTEFTFKGKKFTPKSFLENELKINLHDYVDYMSLMQYDYGKNAVYEVPDNWWMGEFVNVPLDNFINSIKNALKNGFTMAIGGDVSEAGLYSYKDAALVPTFDIPSQNIDENARQFRFSNGTTTDDHGIHIVGYTEKDGKTWFLIKDSGSVARNGKFTGYYMYEEDFVKLKMINFMVHKDALR